MPPNVVLLHAHDLGRHVSPYGHAVETPHLQSLADESLRFRNAHTPAPTCSPSRAAMFTGMAPHAVGMTGLVNRGWTMHHPERHLANRLREAGYDTALAGFQHEHGGPDAEREIGDRTFPGADDGGSGDHRDPDHEDGDAATTAAAEAYLRDAPDQFFLSVGFFRAHRPFPDPDAHGVDPDQVRPFGPLPDVRPVREDVAGFHAAATRLDDHVGRILDALRDEALPGETLVVFTTDHGPAFPRMKCTLSDAGTGVTLLARFPDDPGSARVPASPRGVAVDGLVSHTDFVPTVCEYLGLETPAWVEGESWLPAAADPAGFDGRDAVFGEVTYHAAYEPMRSVRTGRYRYVRRYGEYPREVLPNVDGGPSKRFLVEHGLGEREPPREALYDLYHDPAGRDNLVDAADHSSVLTDLRERLDEWMARTDDPLLTGPVSKPPGAEANPPDAVDPEAPAREPDDAR